MKDVEYNIARIISKLKREKKKETIIKFFKKQGMTIGEGCNICSNITTPESHLVVLGENVTIAGNVEFVTHDNSISKVLPEFTDLFGKIIIGDNCFIGARSIIMYGVTLANNIIVASGSVVTKSFEEERIIIAGNPAKKISTWDLFAEKNRCYGWNLNSVSRSEQIQMQKDGVKLINR